MRKFSKCMGIMALAMALAVPAWAQSGGTIVGTVTNDEGNAMHGVMVSAFDRENEMNVSVFTNMEGQFRIDGLAPKDYDLRARLLGMGDVWKEEITVKADQTNKEPVEVTMSEADSTIEQMPGHETFARMKWENEKDQKNFKMMCGYCHQIGTIGFRTPEEPVDWETMVTRMDGFGGLYKHTQETLVDRLLETYSKEAIEEWPEWTPPPAPKGDTLAAIVTEWDTGQKDNCMIHDLELGKDGNIYLVDMVNDCLYKLNPETAEREIFAVPGGKEPTAFGNPRKGPHSIEMASDGSMWITLALSGEMGKFDPATEEWTIVSSNEAPAPRGAYPHSLRIDDNDVVWYTDAGMNSVFSLDTNNDNKVKKYNLLSADQAVGGGKGESRGITPYGISIAPDGKVWYSKLNGNRIGRIDPTVEDGDIKEWAPPFRGPRRLHVAPDTGIVWVPGFGDGVFASFNPETEDWKVYDMPQGMDEIPYALNIHPQTGDVWICGTGSDSLVRFDPDTETTTVIPMPSRVTYTREIEFDDEGNVWTCNSNYPVRHVERGKGSVLKITMDESRVKNMSTD